MYKLSIVPNRSHKILIPPYPFLALNKKDFKYIEAECPKSSKWYLCEDKQSIHGSATSDCIQELITMQQRSSSCNPVTVDLKKAAYEKLDDQHYTVHFPASTKVHLSCGQDSYSSLHGSYLIVLPHTCYLETSQFTLANTNDRLKGQAVRIMNLPTDDTNQMTTASKISLNSINLDYLHEINAKMSLQSPVHSNENVDYSMYHTTIPLYVVLLSAGALSIGLIYRKYRTKILKTQIENADQLELQAVYTIPETTRRVEPRQLPAQFTTNVFHTRCSTGGGVTEP